MTPEEENAAQKEHEASKERMSLGWGNFESTSMFTKSKEQRLVEHLDFIQANFTKSLKVAYYSGFRDARDEGYLGCDVMARWESSDIKEEIEKSE